MKKRILALAASLAIGFLCGFLSGYKYASATIVCELPAGFFQPADVSRDQNLGAPPQTPQGARPLTP
jgi:hypothetical protein